MRLLELYAATGAPPDPKALKDRRRSFLGELSRQLVAEAEDMLDIMLNERESTLSLLAEKGLTSPERRTPDSPSTERPDAAETPGQAENPYALRIPLDEPLQGIPNTQPSPDLKAGTFLKDSDLKSFAKFFNEIYLDYSRKHKTPLATELDEHYGKRLQEEFGKKTLAQVTPRMIEGYLVKLRQTKTRLGTEHSAATVRRHYDMLNQIFSLAIRERVANDNPCHLVSRSVLKDFPTWEKRERWLNKYDADEEGRLFASFNDYGEHLPAICRIIINTGIRPPKEVLGIKKEHVNLSDEARYYRAGKVDVLIPPRAVLVEKGKDGKPRVLPLNRTAHGVFTILVGDSTTGEWLFTNRGGGPMKSIKKGFAAACERAGIEDLRPYDLRHTFATRLLDRGVHQYVISALLGLPRRSPASATPRGLRPAMRTPPGRRWSRRSKVSNTLRPCCGAPSPW
jgi:integrase/recombinase XerD